MIMVHHTQVCSLNAQGDNAMAQLGQLRFYLNTLCNYVRYIIPTMCKGTLQKDNQAFLRQIKQYCAK